MSDCNVCVHAHRDPVDGTCEAYPSGRPHDIVTSAASHDEVRGDESKPVAFIKQKQVEEDDDAVARRAKQ